MTEPCSGAPSPPLEPACSADLWTLPDEAAYLSVAIHHHPVRQRLDRLPSLQLLAKHCPPAVGLCRLPVAGPRACRQEPHGTQPASPVPYQEPHVLLCVVAAAPARCLG